MPHELTNLLTSGNRNHQDTAQSAGLVAAKFCSFGVVSSVKWFSCYVSIGEGQVRLYDDEITYRNNPDSYVQKIYLTRHHEASVIKRKSYSQNGDASVDLWCFYVQVNNGIFFPTKELKIGCVHQSLAERLVRAVTANAH